MYKLCNVYDVKAQRILNIYKQVIYKKISKTSVATVRNMSYIW